MGYNKTSSFFDNISCESSAGGDRSGGYNRWVPSLLRPEPKLDIAPLSRKFFQWHHDATEILARHTHAQAHAHLHL